MTGRLDLPNLALLGALLGTLSACPHKKIPPDCEHDELERCVWEGAQTKARDPKGTPGAGKGEGDPDAPTDADAPKGNWVQLDRTLADIVEVMGPGLEWPLVDSRARALCKPAEVQGEALVDDPFASAGAGEDPDPFVGAGAGAGEDPDTKPEPSEPRSCPTPDAPRDPAGASTEPGAEAWACRPTDEVTINERALALEAGGGVVALTAAEVGGDESSSILDFALARFDEWCEDRSFIALDGKVHQEFHRCALPEGPYLVVGRFPCDLEADRWQVSIAVMDEG